MRGEFSSGKGDLNMTRPSITREDVIPIGATRIAVNRRDTHGRSCHLLRHVIDLSGAGSEARRIGEDA